MPPPKVYTDEFIEKEAEALEKWLEDEKNLFFKDFSFSRGYSYKRMCEWCKTNPRFADAHARAKDRQESVLMRGGLNRQFDSAFCMFTMKNVCLWNDKQVVVNEQVTSAIAPEAYNTSRDPVNDKSSEPAMET